MDSGIQSSWASDSEGTLDAIALSDVVRVTNELPAERQDINAIKQFSAISQQFIQSYNQLEHQVESLSEALAEQTAEKERKALESEVLAQRLQAVLSTLPNGVVVIDGHGSVQQANEVAVDMLGEPLIGAAWIDIIGRAFAPRSDDGHEISLIDGRRVKVDTQAISSEPGQVVTLTDLTETRRLQADQSREQRLSVIGRMMASLAHQIRTPLSSALLYSGHLASPKLGQEKMQVFQSHMQQSLKQLERRVSDMLLFASGGEAKSQSFTVLELVNSLKKEVVGHLYVDKDIEVNCSLDDKEHSSLYGNQQALCGAISNLIDNSLHACRENKSNGKLTSVSLDIETNEPKEIQIIVTDNGCGIDKGQAETIFEAFYTGKAKGTGLGLAVVKTVVTNFKGNVEVASEPGKGSQFVIRLPLIEQHAATSSNLVFADSIGG